MIIGGELPLCVMFVKLNFKFDSSTKRILKKTEQPVLCPCTESSVARDVVLLSFSSPSFFVCSLPLPCLHKLCSTSYV